MDNDVPPATPPALVPRPDAAFDPIAPSPAPPPDGWAVGAGRGAHWWSEGWRLFSAAPLMWIGITLVFFALMFALALIPFIGQIASTLLYPVLGAGIMVGTREQDRGGKLSIGHLFSCF